MRNISDAIIHVVLLCFKFHRNTLYIYVHKLRNNCAKYGVKSGKHIASIFILGQDNILLIYLVMLIRTHSHSSFNNVKNVLYKLLQEATKPAGFISNHNIKLFIIIQTRHNTSTRRPLN